MNRKRIGTVLLLLAILAALAFIWGNSLESAVESSLKSGRVRELIEPLLELLVGQGNVTDHMVRKLAHLTEFAVLGALFVGIGTGLVVRVGGATSGDDALAMCLSQVTGVRIQWVYLISDLSILALSISYIPLRRIAYSLLTVILSGQLIGFLQRAGKPPEETA